MPAWNLYELRISLVLSSPFLYQKPSPLHQYSSDNVSGDYSLNVLSVQILACPFTWKNVDPRLRHFAALDHLSARTLLYFDQLLFDLRGVKRTPSFVWPIRLT